MSNTSFFRPTWRLLTVLLGLGCLLLIFPKSAAADSSTLQYDNSTAPYAANDGSSKTAAVSVATNAAGDVYVAGTMNGTVTLDGQGGSTSVQTDGSTAYIVEYAPSGNVIWYQTVYTASNVAGQSTASKMVVDKSGNIYLLGNFEGTVTFDGPTGTHTITTASSVNAAGGVEFVTKYSPSGGYDWTKTYASTSGSHTDSLSLAVDNLGDVYTGGWFNGTVTFDGQGGTNSQTSTGNYSGYFTKYSPSGGYDWTKTYNPEITGFSNPEASVSAISVDSNSQPIIAVDAQGGITDVTGQASFSYTGQTVRLMEYTTSGTLNWITGPVVTGSASISGNNLVLDSSNNIFLAGIFAGNPTFGTGSSSVTLSGFIGEEDAYTASFSDTGTFRWAKAPYLPNAASLGDTDTEAGLAIDASGNVYAVSTYDGSIIFDGPNGTNTSTLAASTYSTAVIKYSNTGDYDWTSSELYPGSTSGNEVTGYDATIDNTNGLLYLVGGFNNQLTLDGSNGSHTITDVSSGNTDRQFLVSYFLTLQPTTPASNSTSVASSVIISHPSTPGPLYSGPVTTGSATPTPVVPSATPKSDHIAGSVAVAANNSPHSAPQKKKTFVDFLKRNWYSAVIIIVILWILLFIFRSRKQNKA